jgi:hypothetical protein
LQCHQHKQARHNSHRVSPVYDVPSHLAWEVLMGSLLEGGSTQHWPPWQTALARAPET